MQLPPGIDTDQQIVVRLDLGGEPPRPWCSIRSKTFVEAAGVARSTERPASWSGNRVSRRVVEPHRHDRRLMGPSCQEAAVSKVQAMMVAGVAALASLSGCGGGDASSIQISATAPGTPTDGTSGDKGAYPDPPAVERSFGYDLYTHCGIRFAAFRGRVWETPPRSDGSGNPPAGWDNPTQPGRIHVMKNGDAIFTSFGHHPLTFRLTDAKPPMCD